VLFGLLISALLLVCLTMAVGFWVVRNVSVKTVSGRDGENVSIQTPAGELNVRAHDREVDPEALGIPLYPGAHRESRGKHGGDAVVEWTSRDGASDKTISVAGTLMVTSDPPDKVLAFYRDRLPDWVVKKDSGRTLRLEMRESGERRIIAIEKSSDGTHIGIATVGDPPAN
jgi:hypothetical protein